MTFSCQAVGQQRWQDVTKQIFPEVSVIWALQQLTHPHLIAHPACAPHQRPTSMRGAAMRLHPLSQGGLCYLCAPIPKHLAQMHSRTAIQQGRGRVRRCFQR